jgi:hypothetical protein
MEMDFRPCSVRGPGKAVRCTAEEFGRRMTTNYDHEQQQSSNSPAVSILESVMPVFWGSLL